MSKRTAFQDFYDALNGMDLLEYGAAISREQVWNLLGLHVPAVGTMKEFAAIQLRELGAIDYVRGVLLNSGKYLAGTASGYRILLPSENAGQIENYISSADRKLNRALKLSRNSPKVERDDVCQLEARIMMKRDGVRDMRC